MIFMPSTYQTGDETQSRGKKLGSIARTFKNRLADTYDKSQN